MKRTEWKWGASDRAGWSLRECVHIVEGIGGLKACSALMVCPARSALLSGAKRRVTHARSALMGTRVGERRRKKAEEEGREPCGGLVTNTIKTIDKRAFKTSAFTTPVPVQGRAR